MSQQGEVKSGGRRLGGGAIASLSGVAVLLIFIIQNTHRLSGRMTWLGCSISPGSLVPGTEGVRSFAWWCASVWPGRC
jgi:hypothetical protein